MSSMALATALMVMAHMEDDVGDRKRYVVNVYGTNDEFVKQTSPRTTPKIGGKIRHDGEWLNIWYVEEIGGDVFNVRLERDIALPGDPPESLLNG